MHTSRIRGGLRIFSRGDSQKTFPSSLEALKRPCFGLIFFAAGKTLKKMAKNVFLYFFWKKKLLFKFSICWRRSRFYKFFLVRQPKVDFSKYNKRGPFGLTWIESLKGSSALQK